jgi:hypothetical protein
VRVPLGLVSEIDLGILPGRDFEFDRGAAFFRAKVYVRETDISAVYLNYRKYTLLGFDIARALGGASIWIENAWVFARNTVENGAGPVIGIENSNESDYGRISLGLDYSLTSKIYGFLEYHYNGAGVADPALYLANLSHPAFRDGSVYLLSRHYLTPGLIWQINPLISLQLTALFNACDRSVYCTQAVEYNIAENIYLKIGLYLGLGEKPYGLLLHSEFGSYPDILFTSFCIYF